MILSTLIVKIEIKTKYLGIFKATTPCCIRSYTLHESYPRGRFSFVDLINPINIHILMLWVISSPRLADMKLYTNVSIIQNIYAFYPHSSK